MHEEIMKVNHLANRGKKKADFYVLRETKISELLTENGFIDNANDAEKLKDPNYRQVVAQGHVNGLAKAFSLKQKPVRPLHRVIVDGVQVGAYEEEQNVLNAVQSHLEKAKRIVIEKV